MAIIEHLWQMFSIESRSDSDTRIYKGLYHRKGENSYCITSELYLIMLVSAVLRCVCRQRQFVAAVITTHGARWRP